MEVMLKCNLNIQPFRPQHTEHNIGIIKLLKLTKNRFNHRKLSLNCFCLLQCYNATRNIIQTKTK